MMRKRRLRKALTDAIPLAGPDVELLRQDRLLSAARLRDAHAMQPIVDSVADSMQSILEKNHLVERLYEAYGRRDDA